MKSKLFSEKAERTQISTGRWVRILPDKGEGYQMYDALGEYYIGRILFDANGFWIYDGGVLSVNEQEDVAGYINSYYPEMDNLLKSLEDSMEQLYFFPEAGMSKDLPKEMLEYRPDFIGKQAGDELLEQFIRDTPWRQSTQKMWEKEYLTPRLTAWYGDTDRISGTLPWTPELQAIRETVESLAGIRFNSVLLNYYRDGNDSVAWHSDKESIMGSQPIIASVSFGQVRGFDIRNKADHKQHYSVKLEHSSLLLMKARLQEAFEHRVAKSVKPMTARINLTFRLVI